MAVLGWRYSTLHQWWISICFPHCLLHIHGHHQNQSPLSWKESFWDQWGAEYICGTSLYIAYLRPWSVTLIIASIFLTCNYFDWKTVKRCKGVRALWTNKNAGLFIGLYLRTNHFRRKLFLNKWSPLVSRLPKLYAVINRYCTRCLGQERESINKIWMNKVTEVVNSL